MPQSRGAKPKSLRLAVNLSEVGVGLDEGRPFVRHIVFFEDGVDGAFWLASTAIDALIRVDEHREIQRAFFGLAFDDTFGRANIDTGCVFGVYARLGNDVRHVFRGGFVGSERPRGGGLPRCLAC